MSVESSMNVDGKVIVITGAARGIGQEYARYLGGLGARIVAADVNDCAGTLDLVKTERGTAVGAKLDVASTASAMELAKTALDAFGRIDALVNSRALRRTQGWPLRHDQRIRLGRRHGGERQGHLELLQGCRPCPAPGRRRQHRQHRLAGGYLRHAVRPALHDLQG